MFNISNCDSDNYIDNYEDSCDNEFIDIVPGTNALGLNYLLQKYFE